MKRNKDMQRRRSLAAFTVAAVLAIVATIQVISFESAVQPWGRSAFERAHLASGVADTGAITGKATD